MALTEKRTGDIYKYGINLSILFDDGANVVDIEQEKIQYIYNDFDYDNMNMPMTFVSVALDKNTIDSLITKSNNTLINMTIYKFLEGSTINVNYIHEQFVYFIGKDYNNNRTQDYNDKNTNSEVLENITIGLMKLDLVNNNNRKLGGVLSNTNLASAIYYCCGTLPLIIEPLEFNSSISQLILPTLNSVSKYISYLNKNCHTFYNTKYRFFMDFQNTYLLSSSGKVVPKKGDLINSININIYRKELQGTIPEGMNTDTENKVYIIDIGEAFAQTNTNASIEKTINTVSVVGNNSYAGNATLNLGASTYMKPKETIIRVPNNNTTLLQNKQRDIEMSKVIIEIHKPNLDTSILTINREYTIKATDVYPGRDGKYLLAKKRETYLKENDHFILDTLLTFKKL